MSCIISVHTHTHAVLMTIFQLTGLSGVPHDFHFPAIPSVYVVSGQAAKTLPSLLCTPGIKSPTETYTPLSTVVLASVSITHHLTQSASSLDPTCPVSIIMPVFPCISVEIMYNIGRFCTVLLLFFVVIISNAWYGTIQYNTIFVYCIVVRPLRQVT